FVAKAHPPTHIGICAGGWNAGDGTTGKQDVELFLSRASKTVTETKKRQEAALRVLPAFF
ncbi:MAG: hypothetical protein PVH69_02945, partial [Desulfobacterales bacterium]